MAELKSPTENTYSAKLSQEEIQMPLSPVLGTGQSIKKLLKNRKERHKKDSNKVAQKLENALKLQDETDKNSSSVQLKDSASTLKDDSILDDFKKLEMSISDLEAIPGPSKPKLSLEYSLQDMPENLLDRIEKLEELEAKKNTIIKAISFTKSVNTDITCTTVSTPSSDQLKEVHIDNPKINKDELLNKYSENKPIGVLQKENNTLVHFQTSTGKEINIPDMDIKKSAKLFDDILCPTKNHSPRKKKFNYLTKYESPEKPAVTKTLDMPGSIKKCEEKRCLSTYKSSKNDFTKMVVETSDTDDNQKNNKNILEDNNMGFKAIKTIEGKYQRKNLGKNICDEKDNIDLKLTNSSGFNTSLKIVKDGMIGKKLEQETVLEPSLPRPMKNTFEGENFDDLKLFQNSDFQVVSEKTSKNFTSNNLLQKGIMKRSVLNIFKDENFEDLKLSHITGFHAASSLKNEQINTISDTGQRERSFCKQPKSIFEGDNFDDLKVPYKSGFQSASMSLKNGENLEKVDLPDDSVIKPSKNIFDKENFSDLNFTENVSFKPASVSLKEQPSCRQNDTKAAEDLSKDVLGNILGLQGSNKQITRTGDLEDLNINLKGFENSPDNLKTTGIAKANKPKSFRDIFEGENFDDLNLGALGIKFHSPLTNFKRNLLKNQSFESPYRTPVKNIVDQNTVNQEDDDFLGFNKQEKEIAFSISKNNCDIVNVIENRLRAIISEKVPEERWINLSIISNSSKKLHNDKLKLSLEQTLINHSRHLAKKRKFSEVDSDHNSLCQNTPTRMDIKPGNLNTPLQKSFLKRQKKRLGCPFSPTIQIPEAVLKKAKVLFEDLEHTSVETSTPNKFDTSLAKSFACDLTPVQGVRKNLGVSFLEAPKWSSFNRSILLDQTLIKNNARFSLNKPSDGDVQVWMENLSCEKRLLEERLKIVNEKQTILANQRTILEFSKGRNRILPGFLYKSKSRRERIALKDLGVNRQPEENSTITFLNQVNPQNAHLVHFYLYNKRISHIQTQDGAVIIPTSEGRIGISEIEHSFKVMEGVDPHLIPKGWIQNHYKWVVWKLASYERLFPDKFEGCFCVENVVQQLKYRYDIEIDEVKRSALHKIFERDDCPQRRLVLCVSKIKKINDSYELELTDGWYPIRTVIDPFLCDQILKGKIKLGVKLMTYGAELMNCDGCHPLEASEQIYLKINYNSTRRAAWWTKLGCQKVSGPFLIPLSSVNLDGGKIGCIKCFILRVYPVKYLEKYGETNVWRNRKAEERREQEFYNEKMKALQRTDNILYNEQGKNDLHFKETNKDVLKCIKNVDDPETLYNLLQRSCDPESIQEHLSSSQKLMLYNYTINKSAQNQSNLVTAFKENATVLQERAVTSLLKIKIVDASCESNVVYDFHMWRPQESHVQELKEGEVVTIFNVFCSSKWGLSANRTTQFKTEQKPKDERYQKFRRKVTSIEKLQHFSKDEEILNEFDTVGILVKKRIGNHQQVWLTDINRNLLVIKIYDPPQNVLVLDTVNEGQIIAVCNLVFKHFSKEYSFAVADHFVIFSRYSQHKHLKEAAENLEKELENRDLAALLQLCKDKVDRIEAKWNCRSPNLACDMDDMDCSQITTTDLALLQCVDKLT